MTKNFAILLLVFFIIGSCLIGCKTEEHHQREKSWMTANGKIKVLCTICMIEQLVKQVGGPYVDTNTLVKGELDPHAYQLVKGDDEKLNFADVIFYNGVGLEHGPSLCHYLANNKKACGLGNKIYERDPSLLLNYQGSIDPHIWMDMQLWSLTVDYIVGTLAAHDPSHAGFYREEGGELQKQMRQIHEQLKEEMAKIPEKKRFLITSHDAFNYFTRSYLAAEGEIQTGEWQKRFAAPEGLSPESQLSTADIRMIINHLREHDIRVIFSESNVSQASIRKLVDAGRDRGIALTIAQDPLYADAMGPPGSSGDSYIKMIQHNVRTIAKYLSLNDGDVACGH
ncbi:MAG: zinc ABC transporter substrate-binding protein [Waddliaceae bacterium]